MNFKNLINQDNVKKQLLRTAEGGQLPNSYLFTGQEGVGKWAAALALCAYLNCRGKVEGDSCGKCPACVQIARLQFPNLFIAVPTPPSKNEKEEIENYWAILESKREEPYSLIGGQRQMSIPVDTVRQIRRQLGQKAAVAGTRIVLIEQMDRMLQQSADALLKLIEEPPPQTHIIITSTRPEKLLPTIISRCREIRFGNIPEADIARYVQPKLSLSEKKAQLLARLARGSIGRALYLGEGDTEQDRELAKMIFKGIFSAAPAQLAADADEILPMRDRSRINRIIAVWQTLFRDLITLRSNGATEYLINIDYIAELERLAAHRLNDKNLFAVPEQLSLVSGDIELNVEARAALSAMLLKTQKSIMTQ